MKTLMRQGAIALLLAAAFLLSSQTAARESSRDSRKILVQTPDLSNPRPFDEYSWNGKVNAQVQANGSIKKIDVVGGHPLLTQSAVTAVGHWKFEPGPKERKETIEIEFDPR
jgi:membrane protein involved in colicin uptake